MAGPWEKYQQPAAAQPGPWAKYAPEGNRQFGSIEGTTPSVLERVGNVMFDAGKAIGLPVDQMRRDNASLDAGVRGAADAVTFGTADEIAAKAGDLTGIGGQQGNYEGNLNLQRTIDRNDEQQHPAARLAGQMAGAVALPTKAAASVPLAVAEGAIGGGLYGFGSGEGGFADRMVNAGKGALVGGLTGGAVRSGVNALESRAASKVIPSNDDIRKAAQAAYNKADAAGVIVKPSGMQRLGQGIVQDLYDFGYDPALQPGIAAVVSRLGNLSDKNVTLKGLDVVRRVAGNAAKMPGNPSQQAAASKIIDRIDDFIETLPDEDVLAGNIKHGAEALSEARTLWGRLRRSEMVDSAATKAELRAASTGSGGNVDNATRQNVRRLVENPRGMSEKEKELAEVVVRGSKGQNALRLAGKLSPQGNGLMTAMGVGGAMVNPVLGIPALVGTGAKVLADRATMRNVEKLSQVIRSGGKTGGDLAKLARGGDMDIPSVQRLEKFAKHIGIPVSQMAAMLRERAAVTAE
ncbi:hypothetical protein [Mesorhizobium ciceri]|uniref:hypothetical protein n=1 Tax=Mesorhizobium TaxID=68287 RepID=UPI0004B1A453|nr:hypothetical protein [Mesorhizobium ciceri]